MPAVDATQNGQSPVQRKCTFKIGKQQNQASAIDEFTADVKE